MSITKLSLKNPEFVIVISLLILVLGIISINKLPIQLMPNIKQPQINLFYQWPASSPQELETNIIEPQEEILRQTPDIEQIKTSVYRGFGEITLSFTVGTDLNQALLSVINQLNQAPDLPSDAIEPIVTLGGGQSQPPTATLMIFVSQGEDISAIDDYQQLISDVVYPRLTQVPGVGRVELNSELKRQLRINFDQDLLAAKEITLDNLRQKIITAENISGGYQSIGRRQYTVRFSGQYDPSNLQDLIIGYSNDRPVYLRDIATIELTHEDKLDISLRNGQSSYYIAVKAMPQANTVEVIDGINEALAELNTNQLAKVGLTMELSLDSSVHIRHAIGLVYSNLGIGVFLALAILWLFIRNIRAVIMIALTIPLALASSFWVLSLLDRNINVISLAGIAFAVGLVLDAAIIVQENILRLKQQRHLSKKKAIMIGTKQVVAALFSSTLTSIIIFFPILFMEGVEGQLFSDLALTLSIAVFVSFLTAITVLPVASRYLMSRQFSVEPFAYIWDKLTHTVIRLTNSLILRLSWISTFVLAASLFFYFYVPKADFLPQTPMDGFFVIMQTPPGASLDFIEQEIVQVVRHRLAPYLSGEKQPTIKSYNFYGGLFNAGAYIYPENVEDIDEVIQLMTEEVFANIPGIEISTYRSSMLGRVNNGGERSISLHLQGRDIPALITAAKIAKTLTLQQITDAEVTITPSPTINQPEITLKPNDRMITQSGIDRHILADAVRAFTHGLFIQEYFDGNKRMDVILKGLPWDSPESFADYKIYTPEGGVQRVGDLATIERTVGASELSRVDGKRSITLVITPPQEISLQEVIQQLRQSVIPEVTPLLPDDGVITFSGQANKLKQSIKGMLNNFSMAALILWLLLAALFRSIKDSTLVLLAMPLSLAGGVIALNLLGLRLDLLTMIGFIILMGLVVNNAILLVDHTRKAEKTGKSRKESVREAVRVRARPIYMSTLTSIIGMLPLMINPGPGSEIYRGLATVIVGGMLSSALFILLLLPSLLRMGETTIAQPYSSTTPSLEGSV